MSTARNDPVAGVLTTAECDPPNKTNKYGYTDVHVIKTSGSESSHRPSLRKKLTVHKELPLFSPYKYLISAVACLLCSIDKPTDREGWLK